MIRKILIAEDHESANLSLQKTLEDLKITDVDYVFYCDDAIKKIAQAKSSSHTYDLLITDLSFDDDHNVQQIPNGTELIKAARQIQPDLRVLVFSAESRPAIIDELFKEQEIDGYVRKARHDAQELKQAIEKIANNQQHYPRHLSQLVKDLNTHDFTEWDIAVISLLEQGVLQKDFPQHLKAKGFKTFGLSSVEKRLNHIRTTLNLTTNPQLVAYCKNMGLI